MPKPPHPPQALGPRRAKPAIGPSAWGGWGGFGMVVAPLWWVANYLLFAWLFRRNIPLLIAALAVPILALYGHAHHRFSLLPFILLPLAALLARAPIPRPLLPPLS